MQKHLLPLLLLLLTLSACASTKPTALSPRASEVRLALQQPSPERTISALAEFRDTAWPMQRRLDVQTLITYYSLEAGPEAGSGELFKTEVDNLATLVNGTPLHKIPQDTGVLLYLDNRNNRRILAAPTASAVDKYCALNTTLPVGNRALNRQAAIAARRSLAASCRHYVNGDLEASAIALSAALRWDLSSGKTIIPRNIKPSTHGGWDIFKARLQQETDISLKASAVRLLQ